MLKSIIRMLRPARGIAMARLGALALVFAACGGLAALSAAPARAAEQALLGIRIDAPAKAILHKYGNPTRVQPGAQSIAAATAAAPGARGMAGAPGMNLNMRGRGMAPLPQMPMGVPGSTPTEFGGGGPMYSFGGPPGMAGPPPGFPGMRGRPMAPGAAQVPGAQGGGFQTREVWYVYDKPNGMTYEFLLSPAGRVIQIAVTGYKGGSSTSRGIQLGSRYAEVLAKYGFPESERVEGGVVFLSYAHRDHVAFQLMDNKVIGIIVAYIH